MRAEQARRARRRRLLAGAGTAVAVAAIVAVVALALVRGSPGSRAAGSGVPPRLPLSPLSALGPLRSPPPPGSDSFEGVPIPAAPALAGTAAGASGGTVDHISCQTSEQLLFHIHAHLTIFVNGQARQVPAGIGIPGSRAQDTAQGPVAAGGRCLYWLHTHAPDGIIHIESPVRRTYTLGEFFDEWGQPLGPGVLGPVKGLVVALYDGKVYRGNPRDIPLTAHAQIQLEVGAPLVAPVRITFPPGL